MLVDLLFRGNPIENPSIPITDPKVWRHYFGSRDSEAGIAIDGKKMLEYSPIWQGITMIAGDISQTPIYVYKRLAEGGKERDRSHPAFKLLRRQANEDLTANIWAEIVMVHALLYGNHYSWIEGARFDAEPKRLIPLNPDLTYTKDDGDGLVYITRHKNRQLVFMPGEIFHVRGLCLDKFDGLSIVDYARNTVGRSLASERFSNKFFANGAAPSGVLTHPNRLDEEAYQNLRKSVQEMYGGSANAHRMAILEEGMTWTPMGVDAEKAQMVRSLEFGVLDAARILNIPPHRLGADIRSSYNSLEQENQSYYTSTLGPWFAKIREEAYAKLLTEQQKISDSHTIEELRIALLNADAKTRHEVYDIGLRNGIYNRDEVRAYENLNPIPNGEGKIFLTPTNMSGPDADQEDEGEDSDVAGNDNDDIDESDRMSRVIAALVEQLQDATCRIMRRWSLILQAKLRSGAVDVPRLLEAQERDKAEDILGPIIGTLSIVGDAPDTSGYVTRMWLQWRAYVVEAVGDGDGPAADRVMVATEEAAKRLTERGYDNANGKAGEPVLCSIAG